MFFIYRGVSGGGGGGGFAWGGGNWGGGKHLPPPPPGSQAGKSAPIRSHRMSTVNKVRPFFQKLFCSLFCSLLIQIDEYDVLEYQNFHTFYYCFSFFTVGTRKCSKVVGSCIFMGTMPPISHIKYNITGKKGDYILNQHAKQGKYNKIEKFK